MTWLFLWMTFSIAQAEYRVFELVISNAATGQERVEISTLDPNQYRTYFPVKADESVKYKSTWRCRGNTSGKPLCSRPEGQPTLDQKQKN